MPGIAEGMAATSRLENTASALVVEPNLSDALSMVAVLEQCRFHVTVAETFQQGKERLNSHHPDILLTEIRLAEYNGLHLVLRGKSTRPSLAALVIANAPDPVLETDAEAMGATFLLRPLDDAELTAAVFRTLLREAEGAGTAPIRPPFERRRAERRAKVIAMPEDRRMGDRRRDLPSLLRFVAKTR